MSERQRGSHDGELVGLAVCCPMTEFIASFSSSVPRNREPSTVERVVKRDSLFHWKLPEKEIEKAASRESCHVVKNIILKMWFLIPCNNAYLYPNMYLSITYCRHQRKWRSHAKDHSSNKIAQVTTTSVLWWQRTFDDVGHKNRLRAPSTLRYEAPISGC